MRKETELRKMDEEPSKMTGMEKQESSIQNAVSTAWKTTQGARWMDMENCVNRIGWCKSTWAAG